MISASLALSLEAWEETYLDHVNASIPWRLIVGLAFGVVFVVVSKKCLEQFEDVKLMRLRGAGARQAILFVAVMFFHSFAEGVRRRKAACPSVSALRCRLILGCCVLMSPSPRGENGWLRHGLLTLA